MQQIIFIFCRALREQASKSLGTEDVFDNDRLGTYASSDKHASASTYHCAQIVPWLKMQPSKAEKMHSSAEPDDEAVVVY